MSFPSAPAPPDGGSTGERAGDRKGGCWVATDTTAAGGQPEPVPVTGVWDLYFGQPAPPEGGVNWDAYSHEELYQMLWQDADVADVSTIAADWSAHRTALVEHAEVLREQQAAVVQTWQGPGGEMAARDLAGLAERVERVADFAQAGAQAAERAADALARARAMMPHPAGDPAPAGDAMANWTGATSGSGSPGATPSTSATSASTASTTDGSTAFGVVGSAGFSFYVGANTADMRKQQAIHAMQTYETSLSGSGQMIGKARSGLPTVATSGGDATTPSSAVVPSAVATGTPSWQSLVGSRGLAGGSSVGAVLSGSGGAANALAEGVRTGTLSLQRGPAMTAAQLAESSATRPGSMGGALQPGGSRGDSSDEVHENQLPTIDHALFPVAEPESDAVIGLSGEEGQ